jgi:hypothetical protein
LHAHVYFFVGLPPAIKCCQLSSLCVSVSVSARLSLSRDEKLARDGALQLCIYIFFRPVPGAADENRKIGVLARRYPREINIAVLCLPSLRRHERLRVDLESAL